MPPHTTPPAPTPVPAPIPTMIPAPASTNHAGHAHPSENREAQPQNPPSLPVWTLVIPALVGILVVLLILWRTGFFKPSAPERVSPPAPTTGAYVAPPASSPAPSAPVPAGTTSDTLYTLRPGEWLRVETGGRKFMLNWNTPDKKLRMRWEFWNGKVDEREFEYGKPQDMGTDPCDLNFYHQQGGSVRVTLQ